MTTSAPRPDEGESTFTADFETAAVIMAIVLLVGSLWLAWRLLWKI